MIYFIAFYLIWCGFWWRLRGGAISNFMPFIKGTQMTRLVTMLAITLPLWYFDSWHVLIYALTLIIGLIITGWEEFEDMGLEPPNLVNDRPNYWMRWIPSFIGLKVKTIAYDMIGMAEAGFICVFPTFFALIVFHYYPMCLFFLLIGILFSVAYLIYRLIPLPTIPNFATGREWSEFFAGVLIGLGFLLSIGLL